MLARAAAMGVAAVGVVWLVVWLAKPPGIPDDWPAEFRTIDGVIERRELIGLTRGDVEAKYGTPAHTSGPPENTVTYRLGSQRAGFIGIDEDWLVLRMDAQGKVVEVMIRTY